MMANWAFAPVCGVDYWRVIVTSPETMIFLFFMITDPKTVPGGRVGRVVFGALVAVASVLGMATQSDEFGTKVALLAGLVVLCAARPILDRFVPAKGRGGRPVRAVRAARGARRSGHGPPAETRRRRRRGRPRCCSLFPVAVVVAGTPARGFVAPDTSELLNRTPVHIDQSTLPAITVGQDVIDFDHTLAGTGIQQVLVTLAQNLEVENQALLRARRIAAEAVDHGDRLIQMQAAAERRAGDRHATVRHYDVRHGRCEAARAVRQADRPEPGLPRDGDGHRPDLRLGRQRHVDHDRTRSTRCSPCAAPPANAG